MFELCLMNLLADKKTVRFFQALGEEVDVGSEVYCWRRSEFFRRMRATLGLACAQAATLSTPVVGHTRSHATCLNLYLQDPDTHCLMRCT